MRVIFYFLIFIATPVFVFGETSERQLVSGVGKNVNEALQNAAEIALMNSVGTFIDTETLITKRTEIRDGVRKQSKSFNNEMLESSKGTIEQIDILETRNENGLVYIDAVIVVRVDDLKVLIEPLVKAEKKISKGLFAKVQKTKSQQADKEKLLLKRVFYPIISGDHSQIEILGIDSVDDITDYRPQYLKRYLSNSTSSSIYPNFPMYLLKHRTKELSDIHKRRLKEYESAFVVTIKVELKDDLVNQIKEILNQVSFDQITFPHDRLAKDRNTLSNICQGRSPNGCSNDINVRPICYNDENNTSCYLINLGKPKKESNGKILSDFLHTFKPYYLLLNFKNNYKVILYDNNNKEIFNDYLKFSRGPSDIKFGIYNTYSTYNMPYNIEPRIYSTYTNFFHDYTIYKESYDQIFLKLPDEILSNADRIEIKSEKSREFVSQTKKRPFLGVFLKDINDEIANETGWKKNSGVLINKLTQGGPAERFNFQSGDIILSINDIKIANSQDLIKRIATFSIGEKVEIVIWRDNQKLRKNIILGEK